MDTDIKIKEKNNLVTNIYNYLIKYILPDYSKLKPTNPSKQFGLNYKKTQEFKKFPLVFTTPRYNPITKRLEFGSLEYELEQAKKRPQIKYYHPITRFYWNKYTNQKQKQKFKKFPMIFTSPRYNLITKRFEFNSLDYELTKYGYYN